VKIDLSHANKNCMAFSVGNIEMKRGVK